MASTSLPPIVPRERFNADRRDLLRVGDILIGQARANPRPCLPEFQFSVVEVGAVAPVVITLRAWTWHDHIHCGRSCAPLPSRIRPTDMPRQITA
jgi:hypothetical protein